MPAIVAPVIAIAGSALAAGAAAVGSVVAGATAVAGALGVSGATLFSTVATAALIGAEYLLRPSVSGQPQLPAPQVGAPPVPARKTLRQADMPRCFIFGRTRTAGAYFLYETDGYFDSSINNGSSWGNSPGNTARTLFQGIYISDGPIDGFDAFICDDEAAPVAVATNGGPYSVTDGTADSNTYIFTKGTKYGPFSTSSNSMSGYYAAAFQPINATEAGSYSTLLANNLTFFASGYPSIIAMLNSMWPTTCVGKGITSVYTWACTYYMATYSRPSRFPSGFPEWAFCVRGARVYDPRDTTQTETQSGVWTLYNTTWKWTENPALIAAHFISWLISENLTAITGVDWSSIATAANDCDAIKSTTMRNIGGGTPGAASEPFARMTGVYYFNTPPREFLSKIMAACDGTYSVDQNGRFTMWIGKWEEPAVTFYERDVAAFTEEFVAPVTESVNEIRSTYIEPANSYQRYEATVWRDEASVSKIGRRVVSINYDLVPSPGQAYRLSQRYARRINGKRKLQITLGPRGMLAFKQRVVGLYLPNFGIEQSTWRVEALQPDGNLTRWTATLREITQSVFNDDRPPRDPASTLTVVSAFTAAAPSSFLLAEYDGSTAGTAYVVASMNQHLNSPTNAAVGIVTSDVIQEQTLVFEAAYSTNGGATYTTATTYLSNYIVRTPDLAKGQTVYVKTRYMNADGTYSAYSLASTISI